MAPDFCQGVRQAHMGRGFQQFEGKFRIEPGETWKLAKL